jgi:hypothetical protein
MLSLYASTPFVARSLIFINIQRNPSCKITINPITTFSSNARRNLFAVFRLTTTHARIYVIILLLVIIIKTYKMTQLIGPSNSTLFVSCSSSSLYSRHFPELPFNHHYHPPPFGRIVEKKQITEIWHDNVRPSIAHASHQFQSSTINKA